MSNTHLFLTEVNQVREMICSFVIQWVYTAFTGNFDVHHRTKYSIWIALMCIVAGLWSIHLFEVTPLNIFSFSVISSFHWKLQLLCWNIWAGQRPEECGNSSVLKPMFSVCVCVCVCVCAPEALLRLSHNGVIFILCRHTRVTSLKDLPLFFLTLCCTLLERFLENHSIVFLPQIACYSIVTR